VTNILKARRTDDGWRYNLDGEVGLDTRQTVARLHEFHGLRFNEAREKMEYARKGSVVKLRTLEDA
jgi:hypothetical protein